MTTNVNDMLAGRESRYGSFQGHAKIAQGLKAVMHERSGWDGLAESHETTICLGLLLALAIESWTLAAIVLAYGILAIHGEHA